MRKAQKQKRFLNQKYAMMRYKEGATDQEIAEETGVCKETVALFRKRNFLPPNRKKVEKPKAERKLSPLAKDVAEARRHGMNYGQYKAQFYRPTAKTGRK